MKKIAVVWMVIFFTIRIALFPLQADRIVGNEAGDITDGVEDISDDAGFSSEIKVAVDQVVSRYAIDVIFPEMNIVFDELVWNVNNACYEIVKGAPTENRFEVLIANHSDQPIAAYGNASFCDGVFITCDRTAESKIRVPAAVPKTSSSLGSPQTAIIYVSVAPVANSWQEAIESLLIERTSTGLYTYSIGTVSVFIEKAS